MTTVEQLFPILVALCIPAAIAASMPRRWRVLALILWMLSPVILLLVLGGIEAARNPAHADLGKLLYGLAFIGSLLGLPWLLACLIGFALGSLLRRKRAAPVATAPVPAAPPAPAPPPRAWGVRPIIKPTPRRAYGVAFLILVGALLTIAGATFVTLRFSPDPPPRKLDIVPPMPGSAPGGR